nr:MAG TPA: hypothetical protein [Caudoviricetes sp.]
MTTVWIIFRLYQLFVIELKPRVKQMLETARARVCDCIRRSPTRGAAAGVGGTPQPFFRPYRRIAEKRLRAEKVSFLKRYKLPSKAAGRINNPPGPQPTVEKFEALKMGKIIYIVSPNRDFLAV